MTAVPAKATVRLANVLTDSAQTKNTLDKQTIPAIDLNKYISVDPATGILTVSGIKITGQADFNGAYLKGLPSTAQALVSPALTVLNQATGQRENYTSIGASIGGVGNDFTVGRNLVVANDETLANGLTIGTSDHNGSLTLYGNSIFTGALTITGQTTINGLTTTASSSLSGLTMLLNGFVSNASSSIGADLQVAGALNASGTLQVTGLASFASTTANSLLISTPNISVTTTLYVDGTNGSDSNNCTGSGTAACKTIQAAVKKTCSSVVGGAFDIHIAAGTYAEMINFCPHLGSQLDNGSSFDSLGYNPTYHNGSIVRLFGSTTTPSSVILAGTDTASGSGSGVMNIFNAGAVRLEGLTVSTTYATSNPTAISIEKSAVDFKDVNLSSTGGIISAADYSDVLFEQGDTNTTTITKVGDTSTAISITAHSNLDFNGNLNASTTVNSAFISSSGNGVVSFLGSHLNFFFTGTTGVTKRGIIASGHSFLTFAANNSAYSFYNYNAPDLSTAFKSSAIQLLQNSTFFLGTNDTITFDNVSEPIAVYDNSNYIENSATTWNFTDGSSTTIFVDPTSLWTTTAGTTQGGLTFAQGFGGRSVSSTFGYEYFPNIYYATSTFTTSTFNAGLTVYGPGSSGGFSVSSTAATTTFMSFSTDAAGSTGFFFNTLNSFSSTTGGTGLDRSLFTVANANVNKFAISGGGNVYAAKGFNANSSEYGIGDVAEYVNLVPGENVEPGDVIAISSEPDQYQKTTGSYATDVAGVISDTGAFVIGADGDNRAPLGLAGIVRTKVTTENGPIAVGDYLVSASEPGLAMRYDTTSGKNASIIGMALEPLATDGSDQPTTGRITVLMSKGLALSGTGSVSTVSSTPALTTNSDTIPTFAVIPATTTAMNMVINGTFIAASSSSLNGLTNFFGPTDFLAQSYFTAPVTVSSTLTVTGDALFSGALQAHSIVADSISSPGLTILITNLATLTSTTLELDQEIASSTVAWNALASQVDDLATRLTALENKPTLDPNTLLAAAGSSLTSTQTAIFNNGLKVDWIQSLSDPSVTFLSDVLFIARPYFNADTAGFAVVAQGTKQVDVVFNQDYIEQPVINASITLDTTSSAATTQETNTLFNNDIRFIVANKNTHGFSIILNKEAPVDINFSWIALAVKNAHTFSSALTITPTVLDALILSPTQSTATTTAVSSSSTVPTASTTLIVAPSATTTTTILDSSTTPALSGATSTTVMPLAPSVPVDLSPVATTTTTAISPASPPPATTQTSSALPTTNAVAPIADPGATTTALATSTVP